MPRQSTDSPFTSRMWDTVEGAARLTPTYNASDFRRAIEAADGAFELRAKQMLREQIHSGLVHLAKHKDPRALPLAMESVIVNESRWHTFFDPAEVELCRARLVLARGLAEP